MTSHLQAADTHGEGDSIFMIQFHALRKENGMPNQPLEPRIQVERMLEMVELCCQLPTVQPFHYLSRSLGRYLALSLPRLVSCLPERPINLMYPEKPESNPQDQEAPPIENVQCTYHPSDPISASIFLLSLAIRSSRVGAQMLGPPVKYPQVLYASAGQGSSDG